jgi:hypothetical protein
MIRNVVIHLTNEQPLLADIEALPEPSDVAFVCTNLRTMTGTKPVFVDRSESTFVFPYSHIRFVELPIAAAAQGSGAPGDRQRAAAPAPAAPPPPEEELEIDEDFLKRVRDI